MKRPFLTNNINHNIFLKLAYHVIIENPLLSNTHTSGSGYNARPQTKSLGHKFRPQTHNRKSKTQGTIIEQEI